MTKGYAEPIPDEWTVIQAAKYLNVPPWELIERPRFWTSWAIVCMNAEAEVRDKEQQKAQKRAKRGGG